jgi:crotonobetainyl-CoA:carnitine CoA-transferase CaiB-like acyl-CoA transferase
MSADPPARTSHPAAAGDTPGPLAGIRVIECASIVLGPLTTQLLGDMGADVVKVEDPAGDLTRRIGPQRSNLMGALFLGCNRNKRSVVLDLKDATQREVFDTLVHGADIVVTSIRPSAAVRLGLDHQTLSRVNPQIITCQLEGFGQDGPYAGKAAYDDVVQSLAGLAMLQTVVTGEPRYVPTILADKITAVHAAYAIAAALIHRLRTGRGQAVNVPMFETTASFTLVEHLWGEACEPPTGPMGYPPVATASRRPFRTQDSYLAVMPYTDANWRRFYELIGRTDRMADPVFTTLRGRQENVELVWGDLKEQLTRRTSADWIALLQNEDIPFAAVNTLEDLLTDPHLDKVGFWQSITGLDGEVQRFPRSPLTLEDSPASITRLPPRLGEHTHEVLLEYGVARDLVDQVQKELS